MPLCIHCRRRQRSRDGRGLCHPCYKDPAVRNLYPPKRVQTADTRPTLGDPSTEELDRIIAEQMKCLPDWWEAEREKMLDLESSGVPLTRRE